MKLGRKDRIALLKDVVSNMDIEDVIKLVCYLEGLDEDIIKEENFIYNCKGWRDLLESKLTC